MSADGTWNLTMNTPMGAQPATLTLASDGNTLTGKLSGAQGDVEIQDGKIDGDEASWKITVEQMNMTIETKVKIDGDKMTGEAELGSFGKATLEGTRA